jgi:proline dehydrogenase
MIPPPSTDPGGPGVRSEADPEPEWIMINRAVVTLMPLVPRSLVWRVSRRYIAGRTLDDALATVRSLNERGMSATLDVLGEDATREEAAVAGRDLYLEALASIERAGLDCNVSVKLSQMALRFDVELCRGILEDLVAEATRRGNFVRIDMEDSSVTDATLDLYRDLRRRSDAVGTVVQSYLKRTPDDVARMLEEGIAHLRLCKGIYVEPFEVAHQGRERIRTAYMEVLRQLFEGGATRVGIATNDRPLIEGALDLIRELGVPKERYEFQMLLGVTEGIRTELVSAGEPLRVYVPFGEEWYAYSSRRLRENPKIAGHVIRNIFTQS